MMFEFVTSWVKAKAAELAVRQAQAELQESLYRNYGDIANRYVDTDRLLYGLGLQGVDPEGKPTATRDEARRESRQFVRVNAHARNVVNQITNFTVGAGFVLKFEDDATRDRWRDIAIAMRWAKRRREIVRRQVRDGEGLIRRFVDGSLRNPKAKVAFRFVEPGRIATPMQFSDQEGKTVKEGVRFEDGDPEDVTGYYIDGNEVDADEVFLFRDPFSDLNDVRGWPLIYDARKIIQQYEDWVRTRAVLNELRAAIFAIRKFKNLTPTQIAATLGDIKAGTFTRSSGQTQRYADRPLAGTIMEMSDDVEMEFPGAKIQAGDAEADGRSMRLLIAVFFGFPEYWLTGDASNSNFASTLVAENPGIMAIKAWQEDFADDMVRFVRWALADPEVVVSVAFPNLVTRDILRESQSRALMNEHGVLSRQTWMELANLDPDREAERIAQEGGEE